MSKFQIVHITCTITIMLKLGTNDHEINRTTMSRKNIFPDTDLEQFTRNIDPGWPCIEYTWRHNYLAYSLWKVSCEYTQSIPCVAPSWSTVPLCSTTLPTNHKWETKSRDHLDRVNGYHTLHSNSDSLIHGKIAQLTSCCWLYFLCKFTLND